MKNLCNGSTSRAQEREQKVIILGSPDEVDSNGQRKPQNFRSFRKSKKLNLKFYVKNHVNWKKYLPQLRLCQNGDFQRQIGSPQAIFLRFRGAKTENLEGKALKNSSLNEILITPKVKFQNLAEILMTPKKNWPISTLRGVLILIAR